MSLVVDIILKWSTYHLLLQICSHRCPIIYLSENVLITLNYKTLERTSSLYLQGSAWEDKESLVVVGKYHLEDNLEEDIVDHLSSQYWQAVDSSSVLVAPGIQKRKKMNSHITITFTYDPNYNLLYMFGYYTCFSIQKYGTV